MASGGTAETGDVLGSPGADEPLPNSLKGLTVVAVLHTSYS